jgi:hypothetical protein
MLLSADQRAAAGNSRPHGVCPAPVCLPLGTKVACKIIPPTLGRFLPLGAATIGGLFLCLLNARQAQVRWALAWVTNGYTASNNGEADKRTIPEGPVD